MHLYGSGKLWYAMWNKTAQQKASRHMYVGTFEDLEHKTYLNLPSLSVSERFCQSHTAPIRHRGGEETRRTKRWTTTSHKWSWSARSGLRKRKIQESIQVEQTKKKNAPYWTLKLNWIRCAFGSQFVLEVLWWCSAAAGKPVSRSARYDGMYSRREWREENT